jgi:hypothetical protein
VKPERIEIAEGVFLNGSPCEYRWRIVVEFLQELYGKTKRTFYIDINFFEDNDNALCGTESRRLTKNGEKTIRKSWFTKKNK